MPSVTLDEKVSREIRATQSQNREATGLIMKTLDALAVFVLCIYYRFVLFLSATILFIIKLCIQDYDSKMIISLNGL